MKKKLRIFAITAASLAALVVAALVFTACGTASITSTYVYGEVASNSYGGNDSTTYQVTFYDDGSYEMIETTVVYAYSMNLGTTAVTTYGTYTEGASSDGYTPYTLSDATRVILNSYSTAGGFNISIDTELTTEWPAELPAQSEGEKIYANGPTDVINAYGKGMTIYINDDNNTFSLTDPNA